MLRKYTKRHTVPHPPRTTTTQDRRRYDTDLTDAQWEILRPLLPPAPGGGRPRTTYLREVVRAPHSCIAYAARSWNHPAMSSGFTSCRADANAAYTASVVRAAADLMAPLTFE